MIVTIKTLQQKTFKVEIEETETVSFVIERKGRERERETPDLFGVARLY